MKKRNEIISALMPLVITISLYLVFYTRIECKPDQAGFWIILALGASIGVVITRFAQRAFTRKD
jgi:presenilin-like A22 family membrane protease